MAKITIEIDTEANIINVDLNGNKLANISSIYVYNYYDMEEDENETQVEIMQSEKPADGVSKMTRYSCSGSKLELKSEKSVASKPKVKVEDLSQLLANWRK